MVQLQLRPTRIFFGPSGKMQRPNRTRHPWAVCIVETMQIVYRGAKSFILFHHGTLNTQKQFKPWGPFCFLFVSRLWISRSKIQTRV